MLAIFAAVTIGGTRCHFSITSVIFVPTVREKEIGYIFVEKNMKRALFPSCEMIKLSKENLPNEV